VLGLRGEWADTVVDLAPGRWHNVLTGDEVFGGEVGLGDLLARFPVALLERVEV
jgi:(1->4)-alpha-D-glucan 1-alpha-D-glucosylmutase